MSVLDASAFVELSAVYVALAEALDTTLITCDRKLARAPGMARRIMLAH